MNQEKLENLIKMIENGNQNGDVTLKYGRGDSLNLHRGGELIITEDGWITVVNNNDGKTHLINLESVYEIIMDLDLE